MKPLLLALVTAAGLSASNCSQQVTLSAAGTTPALNTITGAQAGCTGWRLTWSVTGFIAISISIQGSQDGFTWNDFPSSVVQEGSNLTFWTPSTVSNTIVIRASLPYIRVDLLSVTAFSPGPPTTNPPIDGGSCDPGNHLWSVTFVSASGETTNGPGAEQICVRRTGTQEVLTNVPTGPAGTLYRNIYRTMAFMTQPYYLDCLTAPCIADNTTTTFSDTLADAYLGGNPPAPIGTVKITLLGFSGTSAQNREGK